MRYQLHGFDAALFLRTCWQQKSKLIRNALPGFCSPIEPDDLAWLACQPDALARLVSGTGRNYALQQGPFAETAFTNLPSRNWTLLVQDVDKFDPEVRALLSAFDFLPRWRIEDIMCSFAVPGGSVGAHVDQYDVFLLQARGHRRWEIDTRKAAQRPENQQYRPHQALRLLQSFTPNQSYDLAPGDILYLPPGVPHHGVSLSPDCMTFSIGMRAPSHAELIEAYFLDLAKSLPETLRFKDHASANRDLDSFLPSEINALRALLIGDGPNASSDMSLERWMAGFFTCYRSSKLRERHSKSSEQRWQKKLQQTRWRSPLRLDPKLRAMRLNCGDAWVIAGREFALPDALARQLMTTGLERINLSALSKPDSAAIAQLYCAGALI